MIVSVIGSVRVNVIAIAIVSAAVIASVQVIGQLSSASIVNVIRTVTVVITVA